MPELAHRLPLFARVLLAAVLAVSTTLSVSLATAPPAIADIRHDIKAAQAKLDALNNAAEAAAERYNAARLRLATAQQRAQSAGAALDRAQARLDRTRQAISTFAVQAYMGGSVDDLSALMSGSSPAEYLDKLATLQAVSNSQRQALAAVAAASHDQAQAKAVANASLQVQKQALTAAETEKQTVQRNAQQAQQILTDLQRKQAQLIAAAKAAAARRAAEAQAAALAREQQLAAIAAAAFARQSLTPSDTPTPVHYSGDAVATALSVAKAQLGKPYVWGAAGPDTFDCSGLTMYAYGKAGIYLPHYTGDQWNQGRHVSEGELRPGDLVFFNTDAPLGHMGMYLGGGEFIHAPHTGDVVKISSLSGYYQQVYAGAVRLVG